MSICAWLIAALKELDTSSSSWSVAYVSSKDALNNSKVSILVSWSEPVNSNSTNLPSCSVNVESTDSDSSLIDEDKDEDKSVRSLLTWSNDVDTDWDNSLIEDDNDDESVVNSLSITKFSSLPNGPPIHLSVVVSHNKDPETKFGWVGSLINRPPNASSLPFNSITLSSKTTVSDWNDVNVPKTFKSPFTVRLEPVNSKDSLGREIEKYTLNEQYSKTRYQDLPIGEKLLSEDAEDTEVGEDSQDSEVNVEIVKIRWKIGKKQ